VKTQLPIEVHADATKIITAAATAARPRETGGLLLGWWDNGRVIVRHAIEVADPHATASSWSRDQPRAQAALDTALAELGHPWLGYVGDWHSHPAPCGASAQDLICIRRASRQYDQPLILIIHQPDDAVETIAAHHGRQRETADRASTRRED
jgi:integrative and conjugative element protein (TIGR02256 family)